jgi:protein-tyrosine-phosphatase
MEKTMPIGPATVLFLCTGNSARSILAEAILNDPAIGQGRFRGVSAGSHPRGSVNPLALEILCEAGLPTTGLRSKSWEEFGRPDSPPLDFVFTMCDDAAGETCPIWPGHPATAHWGLPDPAAVDSDDEARRRAFRNAYAVIRRRIARFTALPFDTLDAADLDGRLAEIGHT